MKRAHLNLLIDIAAFVVLLLLISTGMLIEFRLPPGSGGGEPRGLGPGVWDRPFDVIWGWTRHEWGEFHFWVACSFIALLSVHLVLHWKWIVCFLKDKSSHFSRGKITFVAVILTALIFSVVLPLVSPKHQTTLRERYVLDTPVEDLKTLEVQQEYRP